MPLEREVVERIKSVSIASLNLSARVSALKVQLTVIRDKPLPLASPQTVCQKRGQSALPTDGTEMRPLPVRHTRGITA